MTSPARRARVLFALAGLFVLATLGLLVTQPSRAADRCRAWADDAGLVDARYLAGKKGPDCRARTPAGDYRFHDTRAVTPWVLALWGSGAAAVACLAGALTISIRSTDGSVEGP